MFLIGFNSMLILFTITRVNLRRRGEKAKTPFMPLGGIGVSSRQIYTAALDGTERVKPGDTQ